MATSKAAKQSGRKKLHPGKKAQNVKTLATGMASGKRQWG